MANDNFAFYGHHFVSPGSALQLPNYRLARRDIPDNAFPRFVREHAAESAPQVRGRSRPANQ